MNELYNKLEELGKDFQQRIRFLEDDKIAIQMEIDSLDERIAELTR